jgi:hypothetical protein
MCDSQPPEMGPRDLRLLMPDYTFLQKVQLRATIERSSSAPVEQSSALSQPANGGAVGDLSIEFVLKALDGLAKVEKQCTPCAIDVHVLECCQALA